MRRFLIVLVALIASLGAAAPAQAADITGTWDLPSGSVALQEWTFSSGTGTLAGEGKGGPYTWPMEGTIAGDQVQILTAYRNSSYKAYFVGTVSADGSKMSGTWATGGYAVAQTSGLTWVANRRGGAVTPTPNPVDKRASGMQVRCDRGPNPGDTSVCTATVGDATSSGTPTAPTGAVTFAARDGGSFLSGDTCALVTTSTSPSVASCTAIYTPPVTPVFPDVLAEYGGDSTHNSTSASTQFLTAGIAGLEDNTPATAASCGANVKKAPIGKAKAAINDSYNSRDKAGLTTWGEWAGNCVYNGASVVGQLGTAVVGGGGSVVVGIGLPVAGVAGGFSTAGPGGAFGLGVAGAGVGYAVASNGLRVTSEIIQSTERARRDPPDTKFKVLAARPKAKKAKVLTGKGGVGKASARKIAALLDRQSDVAARSRQFAATVDKLGGARQAGDNAWRGKQARAGITQARQLAAKLDALIAARKTTVKLIPRSKATTQKLSASAVAKAKAAIGGAKGGSLLKKLGFNAEGIAFVRSSVAATQPTGTKLSILDAVKDSAQDRMLQDAATVLRYWSIETGVAADAALQ
ncbi:MAG: hypothetical protein V9E83_01145 [Baekduia sp.]